MNSELPRSSDRLAVVFRAAYPKVTAVLVRVLGDIDRAEEMTQEAIVRALKVWPTQGLPDDPAAWLIRAGRNKAVDVFRHEQHRKSYQASLRVVQEQDTASDFAEAHDFDDDLLRLIFTCCHPILTEDAQVALTLKTVLGFSVDDIARAFLSSRGTVDKRLTRAKQKIKQANVPYEIPDKKHLPERINGVLSVIYLTFNKGYWADTDPSLYRSQVCDDAIRLARMVTRLFNYHPEARALLAMMLLTSARAKGRIDQKGQFVPLHLQDRSLWDQQRIREGLALIDGVYLARNIPGPYQLQAGISAIHSAAKTAEETDWAQIAALYQKLETIDPSPVTQINCASALANCDRLDEAKELIDKVEDEGKLEGYQSFYLAKAYVLRRMGDVTGAKQAQQKAIELSNSEVEKTFLSRDM